MKHVNATLNKALRWIWQLVAAVVLLCLLTAAALWGGTRIYQYRVEQLYMRTLRLRVGTSPLNDVQQLAKDYKANVEWQSAACDPAECKIIIRIRHTRLPMLYFDLHASHIGTRPAMATTTVITREGKVSYVSFAMAGVSPTGRLIEASFNAAQDLTMFDKCSNPFLGSNSTYTVRAVPHRGSIRTAFGSGVTEQVRTRATHLRIECFTTAIRDCDDVQALMPRAYEGYSRELDCDASFARQCQKYAQELESHPPPWKVESAFYDEPVALNGWMLDRCGYQSR